MLTTTNSFEEFRQQVDYSLLRQLKEDPHASADGLDHRARQVTSGHYVPVRPTPLPDPAYVAHTLSCSMSLG